VSDPSTGGARASLRTVAVTGTNGKTTTTSMIEAIVAAAGEHHARMTTLGAWVDGEALSLPDPDDAFRAFADRAAARGVRTLAVEATSQALALGFARAWPVEVGVFTNLSRDHLDAHGDLENYLAAKAQLFLNLPATGAAVFNLADPASALLDEVTPPGVRRLGYAARPRAPGALAAGEVLEASEVRVSVRGTEIDLAPSPLADALGGSLRLPVIGRVHAENALAAAAAAHALGHQASAIRAGLEAFSGVPGRFQIVHQAPLVVVDFAHTPDALERALRLARELAGPGRVTVIFGCGGARDAGKRPEMGRAAGALADRVLITSDNPRHERPDAIARAIAEGARGAPAAVEIELDRALAIERGISLAAGYDVVVISGKGHEQSQIVGDRAIPFDDAEVAAAVCDRLFTERTPR